MVYDELCSSSVKPVPKPSPERSSDDSKLKAKKLGSTTSWKPKRRKNYERHMYPIYGEDAYALRGCLKGDAEKAVQGHGIIFNIC